MNNTYVTTDQSIRAQVDDYRTKEISRSFNCRKENIEKYNENKSIVELFTVLFCKTNTHTHA